MTDPSWVRAIRETARRWSDPEHPPRAAAAEATLAAANRFTTESVAFTLNHVADLVARGGLEDWMGDVEGAFSGSLGIVSRGYTPAEGLFEALAASLVGGSVAVSAGEASPAILEAFFSEVADAAGENRARHVAEAALIESSEAVISSGDPDHLREWHERLDAAGFEPEMRLLSPSRTGMAVLDGTEDRAALSGLAEDVLLHEGGTPQSVRVVFAPAGLSPDGLLGALAGFREVFPPHPETDGALAVRAAFLEASGVSLAVGPGFLVTRGNLDVQEGAHLRWVEYGALPDVAQVLGGVDPAELFIVASPDTASSLENAGLSAGVRVVGFGDAHRPVIGQPPLTSEVPGFLKRLAQKVR